MALIRNEVHGGMSWTSIYYPSSKTISLAFADNASNGIEPPDFS